MKYEPKKEIKAQALTDFIAELQQGAKEQSCMNNPVWTLRVDGVSGIEKQRAGLILKRPEGMEFTKAVKFSFSVINNVAEYEALISGLDLARKTDIRSLKDHSNSNLFVQQMNGEYDVHDSTLKKYVELVKESAQSFEQLQIEAISLSQWIQKQIHCQKLNNIMMKELDLKYTKYVVSALRSG